MRYCVAPASSNARFGTKRTDSTWSRTAKTEKKFASTRDAVPSNNVRPGALAIDDYSNCDTGTKRKTSLRHESEDR